MARLCRLDLAPETKPLREYGTKRTLRGRKVRQDVRGVAYRRSVGAPVYSWRMDTREAAQRWAEVWERGWREHDAAAISALYAEDAFWQQHPFREPEPGYLARVFAEEESAQCQFGTPIVDGDQAAVPWSAQTRLKDGGSENLAGVSLLRFRTDGLVSEERDFTQG